MIIYRYHIQESERPNLGVEPETGASMVLGFSAFDNYGGRLTGDYDRVVKEVVCQMAKASENLKAYSMIFFSRAKSDKIKFDVLRIRSYIDQNICRFLN